MLNFDISMDRLLDRFFQSVYELANSEKLSFDDTIKRLNVWSVELAEMYDDWYNNE